jgi:hypothetical protein
LDPSPVNQSLTTRTSRRAILAGAASLATIVPSLAIPAAPDPIFAAIENHTAARTAFWVGPPGETDKEADERLERTGGAADEAFMDFLETEPTTLAGCVAALRHVHQHVAEYEDPEANIMENCTEDLQNAGAGFIELIADAITKAGARS